MELQQLTISKNQKWESRPNDYKGHIRYSEITGAAVEIPLTDEISRKILAVIAEDVVAASKLVAQDLMTNTLLAVAQIEDKS